MCAVGGELEAVGVLDGDGKGGDDAFGGDVHDRQGVVFGVGDPDLFVVGGEVEAFGAATDGDDGLVPIFAGRAGWRAWRRWGRFVEGRLGGGGVGDGQGGAFGDGGWAAGARERHGGFLEEADGGGVDVGGDDAAEVGRDEEHVGAVLAGAEDPVDLFRGGIVAADGFGGFGGEPDFVVDEGEAVRAAESAEINGGKGGLVDEIDDGKGVVRAEAVVRDEGSGAVGGGDDLVGVVADGDAGEDLEGGGIDDGEGVGSL